MRVVLILNPTSGISNIAMTEGTPEEHEEAILSALRMYGVEPQVCYTTPEDAGENLAAQAAADHADIVIAAGGDGTIHAVATALIGTQSALGIIPMGTMNNLAHSLHIPDTVEAACAIIAKGETRAVDIGKINEHVFLEVAGAGLEAALFPAAEEVKSRGLLSTLHGIFNGLSTLFHFHLTKFKLTFDEGKRRRSYEAIQVTICNTAFYGAHFQAAPHAIMDDGLLDVVIYKHFSKLEYIAHAISISQGRRVLQPKITYRRVKSLRISSELPMEVQADGIAHGYTPALVTIVPGALRVRVPGKTASGQLSSEFADPNTLALTNMQ